MLYCNSAIYLHIMTFFYIFFRLKRHFVYVVMHRPHLHDISAHWHSNKLCVCADDATAELTAKQKKMGCRCSKADSDNEALCFSHSPQYPYHTHTHTHPSYGSGFYGVLIPIVIFLKVWVHIPPKRFWGSLVIRS